MRTRSYLSEYVCLYHSRVIQSVRVKCIYIVDLVISSSEEPRSIYVFITRPCKHEYLGLQEMKNTIYFFRSKMEDVLRSHSLATWIIILYFNI
jgi:hypothetical protein